MAEIQIIISSKLSDLNPVVAGRCEVGPNHNQTLRKISYVLIHYVRRGSGTYYINGHSYPISEGSCYMTFPGEDAMFISNSDTNLELEWVGFTGQLSHDFSVLPPVFEVSEPPFPHIKTLQEPAPVMAIGLAGDLFHLHYELLGSKTKKLDYVQYISEYVRMHYMEKISVEAFAKEFGIDRRHMSAQFKKKTGYSIQEYITKIRIDEAMSYLAQGYSSKEVSKMCGYTDTHNFYKTFKKIQGLRPSAWKERHVMLERKYHEGE